MYKRAFFVLGLMALFLIVPHGASAISPQDAGLKEGNLISSQAYDGDFDIYIINQSGYKRLFLNPAIFGFYGHLKYSQVISVTPQVRDQFITANYYRNCEAGNSKVYSLEVSGEDSGLLHHINMSAQDAINQDANFTKKVFCTNNQELNWYQQGAAYASLTEVIAYTGYNLTVLSPKSKETWIMGSSHAIKWQTNKAIPQGYSLTVALIGGPTSGLIRLVSAPQSGTFIWDTQGYIIAGDLASALNPGIYGIELKLYDGTPCLGLCPPGSNVHAVARAQSAAAVTIQ